MLECFKKISEDDEPVDLGELPEQRLRTIVRLVSQDPDFDEGMNRGELLAAAGDLLAREGNAIRFKKSPLQKTRGATKANSKQRTTKANYPTRKKRSGVGRRRVWDAPDYNAGLAPCPVPPFPSPGSSDLAGPSAVLVVRGLLVVR